MLTWLSLNKPTAYSDFSDGAQQVAPATALDCCNISRPVRVAAGRHLIARL